MLSQGCKRTFDAVGDGMKKLIGGLLFAMVLEPAVSAQETTEKYFDGFYVGAEIGIKLKSTIDFLDETLPNTEDRYLGGVLGWRQQNDDGFVWGVEGSYGDTDAFQHQFFAGGLSGAFIRDIWSATGHMGLALGPGRRNLLFVGGGYANMRAGFDAIVDGVRFTPSEPGGGYRVLAGYEHAIFNRLNLRLQTNYSNFPNQVATWITSAGLTYRFW